ncbi:MAG: GNAT family protein [Yoonia sp.]|nr:GNAT family protein [Yoonia sp.]
MSHRINALGQPIGLDIEGWVSCPRPPKTAMLGTWAHVVPLSRATHLDALFDAFATDETGQMWTYLPNGPFEDRESLSAFLDSAEASADPLFYAILEADSGRALGFASYLRIDPAVGVIEVGFIVMSPLLQKTRIATDAMYLMMSHVFDDLGYRRFEWKCDNLNGPSKRAARRYGFHFDGMFPQATIYKGRNRDTAWFSILDKDWPEIRGGFQAWLDPGNFDEDGIQKSSLVTRKS